MAGITNEMMFYGGIALAALSAAGLAVYLLLFRLRKQRLNMRLDEEYGRDGEK